MTTVIRTESLFFVGYGCSASAEGRGRQDVIVPATAPGRAVGSRAGSRRRRGRRRARGPSAPRRGRGWPGIRARGAAPSRRRPRRGPRLVEGVGEAVRARRPRPPRPERLRGRAPRPDLLRRGAGRDSRSRSPALSLPSRGRRAATSQQRPYIPCSRSRASVIRPEPAASSAARLRFLSCPWRRGRRASPGANGPSLRGRRHQHRQEHVRSRRV
jgi:hypothetical protein